MSATVGGAVVRSAYDLAFQVSPIILTGGIASGLLGNAVPIIALVGQLAAFGQSVLSSGNLSLNNSFATFVVIPGGNIVSNSVATYPFANQRVAANAIIENPLNISLQMIAPVKADNGYLTKLAIYTALRTSLQQHNLAGGTYTIATPAFIYTNCLMTGVTDITGGETKQQQVMWQFDFVRPLITLQQATAAFNATAGKLAGGQSISGPVSWSGAAAATGTQAPGGLSLVAGAQGLAGGVNQFLAGAI